MIKINYVSYVDPYEFNGGGEKISRVILDYLKDNFNAEIRISSLRPMRLNFFNNSDITIFCDIDNISAAVKKLKFIKFPLFFLKMIKGKNNIHFSNAYVDLCNKDYLPCSGDAQKVCPFDNKLCKASSKRTKFLYNEVDKNIFLSPLHKKISEKVLAINDTNEINSFVMKPCVDTNLFYKDDTKKDIENIFIGVIGEAKGVDGIKKYIGNEDIKFVGRISDNFKLDFGEHLGFKKYDEIPSLLRRSKNFIYCPRWPEPQGRVVVEAALCGCNIKGNKKSGAESFTFDLSDPSNYLDSVELIVAQIVENTNA